MAFLGSWLASRRSRMLALSGSASLRARIGRATGWVLLGRVLAVSSRSLKLLVLARLLGPADFGVMAIALLILGLLDMLTETGFNAALIQRGAAPRADLDTAFTVQATRGVVLAGGLFLGGPYVASVFGVPEAAAIIQVVGLVPLLRGFENPGMTLLVRRLDFRRVFLWNASEVLTGLAVALALSTIYRNAWILVAAAVAGQAARTAVSYGVQSYRPRFRLNRASGQSLFSFGRWVFGSNLVVYACLNVDSAFVAWWYGPAGLGIYQMAFRISELPFGVVSHVVAQVGFPMFAALQGRRDDLARTYFRSVRVLVLVNAALGVVIWFVSGWGVAVVFGDRWAAAVGPLRILLVAALLRAQINVGGWLFNAVGDPRRNFAMNVTRLAAMVAAMPILATLLGLDGVAVSVVIGVGAAIPVCLFGTATVLGMSVSGQVARLLVGAGRPEPAPRPSHGV